MTALRTFGNGPVTVKLVFCEKQISGFEFACNDRMVLPIEGDTIGRLGFLTDRQKMLVVWIKMNEHKYTDNELPFKQSMCDFIAETLFPQAGKAAEFDVDSLPWPSQQIKDLYTDLKIQYIDCSLWEVVWREFNYDKEGTDIELWLDTIE